MTPPALEEVERAFELLEKTDPPESLDLMTRESDWHFEGRPILLAKDAEGSRRLLIPVDAQAPIETDDRSSGVRVGAHSYLDRGVLQSFVDVTCRKPHLREHFHVIVVEILEDLGAGQRPDLTAIGVLDRWRALLNREPGGIPGIKTLTGLFGELVVLEELAGVSDEACSLWHGPDGARHDFTGPGGAIEVKSSRSTKGPVVEIHGAMQLVPPAAGGLFLSLVMLEQHPTVGRTIPEVLDALLSLGIPEVEIRRKLLKAGIRSDQMSELSEYRFTVADRSNWVVDEAFPRVVPDSFVDGELPGGVEDLTYRIHLSGPEPEPLTEAEWQEALQSVAGLSP